MSLDYSKLQNGSDIRGVALPGEEGKAVNLTRTEAIRLTLGFAKWLAEKTGKETKDLKFSVGHDSRLTAGELKSAICDAFGIIGAEVIDCGLASTPAMFMSTIFDEYSCDGAIMITASHLPFTRNGFKYFDKDGGLNKPDITSIIRYAETAELPDEIKSNEVPKASLMTTYANHLKKMIVDQVNSKTCHDKPLTGLKIVVDAGNGAGGFYARDILEPLGADVTGSQFLEPDGSFPNHAPNPEDKKAMASICKAVIDNNADFGLIFDTDVDRSSAVDGAGKEINRNAIVAMAAALIAKEYPGTTVVTDSITSDQLTDYIEKCLGLKHLRFKRGYKNVINKSMELNAAGIDSQLAIETSGHAAYKENYFLDDGAYLATKIVIKAAQLKASGAALNVVLESLKEPIESVEYRFGIKREDFSNYAGQVLDGLKNWAEGKEGKEKGASLVEPNYEGIRINFKNHEVNGWCLLRKSLHDPQMPLNIEVTEGSCQIIMDYLMEYLGAMDLKL